MSSRILVIEDESTVAEIIRTILESEGYVVATAGNAADGLSMAVGWKPDLILLDIRLPDANGSSITKQLKDNPQTNQILIVAMSAGSIIRDQSNDLSQVDGALFKPFDIDALSAQVSLTLARQRFGNK